MPFIHHRSKESDYELLSQAAESLYGGDDEEAGQQHRVRFVVPAPRPKRHGLCLTAVASVMLVVFALTLARSYYLLTPTYSLTQYYTPTAASAASNDPLSQPALAHNEAHDLSMNSTTCAANFPAFYAQLKANEEHWKLKGGITQALVDRVERTGKAKTKSRIIIKDGQLFIRSYRPDQQSRTKSLFHLIHSALVANPTSADGRVPDVDLALSAEDKGLIEQPGWVLEQRSDAGAGQWLLVSALRCSFIARTWWTDAALLHSRTSASPLGPKWASHRCRRCFAKQPRSILSTHGPRKIRASTFAAIITAPPNWTSLTASRWSALRSGLMSSERQRRTRLRRQSGSTARRGTSFYQTALAMCE